MIYYLIAFIYSAIIFYLSYRLAIIIHETGHLVLGKLTGYFLSPIGSVPFCLRSKREN